MGLDLGEKRVGVAISDPSATVATPLTVLDASCLEGPAGKLAGLLEDYGVEDIVVGLPLSLSGEEGPQALKVRETAERLSKTLGAGIVYWDERLSTTEAARVLPPGGGRRGKGALDMLAATLILQSYLDSKKRP